MHLGRGTHTDHYGKILKDDIDFKKIWVECFKKLLTEKEDQEANEIVNEENSIVGELEKSTKN